MKGTALLCITAVLALLLAGCGNGDAAVSAGADDNTPAVTAPLPAGGENSSAETQLPVSDLSVSTQWDGDLAVLAAARTPVYMVIGENDSYYGSGSLKAAYAQLRSLYEEQGLSEDEINRLVQLDVKPQEYFTQRGFSDQHAGSAAFSHDETVTGWLFGPHDVE